MQFDHTKNNLLETMSLTSEEADKITADESHPDCLKLRLMSVVMGGDSLSTMTVLISLFAKEDLRDKVSENFEKLFQLVTEQDLKWLDVYIKKKEKEVDAMMEVMKTVGAQDAEK